MQLQLLLAGQHRGLLAEGLPRRAWPRLQLAVALKLLLLLHLLVPSPWTELAQLTAEQQAWHQALMQL
jgi:hypothetical protein